MKVVTYKYQDRREFERVMEIVKKCRNNYKFK